MSGKHKHRAGGSESTENDRRRGDLDDLELIVEGKKVKANSGLLINNSSVFASLISNVRATREADDFEQDFRSRRESPHKVKLEMPNMKYEDVKTLIGCLQTSGLTKEGITGVKALRILPMVDHFRMSHLKRACGKALYESLLAMQKDHGTGNLPSRVVLQYLGAAEEYSFEKVRKICVEELAVNADAPNRKQIIQDKHIHDKTKVKIMDRMFDKMSKEYGDKLTRIRLDMDQRCREIERRRDEFMEQLEVWKTDLRQEVDDIIKNNTIAHEQLVKDLHQKKIADRIDVALRETTESLFAEMTQLKEQINFVFETMEAKEVISDMEACSLKEALEGAQESNRKNVESIAYGFKKKMESKLRVCSANESYDGFSSGYNLEESMNKTVEEFEEQLQKLALNQVKLEEERFAHEKTKAELMKLKLKEHKLNTWLKWAKPAVEDEDKCMCFRHSVGRK